MLKISELGYDGFKIGSHIQWYFSLEEVESNSPLELWAGLSDSFLANRIKKWQRRLQRVGHKRHSIFLLAFYHSLWAQVWGKPAAIWILKPGVQELRPPTNSESYLGCTSSSSCPAFSWLQPLPTWLTPRNPEWGPPSVATPGFLTLRNYKRKSTCFTPLSFGVVVTWL